MADVSRRWRQRRPRGRDPRCVAAGAVLVDGRASAFLAAIATIAVLYAEFSLTAHPSTARLFSGWDSRRVYFATCHRDTDIIGRLRRTNHVAHAPAEVADLERVNRSIIQRMRTGIIVVDRADGPRLNQSVGTFAAWSAGLKPTGSAADAVARLARRHTDQDRGRLKSRRRRLRYARTSAPCDERPDVDVIVFPRRYRQPAAGAAAQTLPWVASQAASRTKSAIRLRNRSCRATAQRIETSRQG